MDSLFESNSRGGYLRQGYSQNEQNDVLVEGNVYSKSPRIFEDKGFVGNDVLIAPIGNQTIIIGQGGYHAPRS